LTAEDKTSIQLAVMARRVTLLTLLVALVTLGPVANATPADQTWVGGVFDDNDADDVVIDLSSGSATMDPFLSNWDRVPVCIALQDGRE
jgi:hypothetical protein